MDTWAYAVPRLAMLEALREDWALNQRFLELCFRKTRCSLGQVRELSFDQAERRIARTLLNLAAQYGRPCPEGCASPSALPTRMWPVSSIQAASPPTR
ncbi:MAG: hypothetical protein ACLRNQ_22200 [Flavonifractor plautii]